MSKALKFGGTSMANAKSIMQVKEIILSDPEADYIVVSAPGKREPSDIKVTDLLIKFYNEITKEGKRKVQAATLFFMPHCGFSLYFDSIHLSVDTIVLYGRIGESRSRA